jgi:hypothetical protein
LEVLEVVFLDISLDSESFGSGFRPDTTSRGIAVECYWFVGDDSRIVDCVYESEGDLGIYWEGGKIWAAQIG